MVELFISPILFVFNKELALSIMQGINSSKLDHVFQGFILACTQAFWSDLHLNLLEDKGEDKQSSILFLFDKAS